MKKFSFLILGLSIFLILSAAGLYFALQVLVPFFWILIVLGLTGLIYFAVSEKSIIIDFLNLKTTQKGFNMGTVFFLVFFIVIFANYISVKYVSVFDYSMTRQYTLSDQSKKIIENLNDDLQIKFFYKEGLQNIDATKKTFLAQAQVFKTFSSKVKVSSHEMNSDPELTEKFAANKGTGEGFIYYKGKINRIESQYSSSQGEVYTEQSFINAIIKTTREKIKNVYFLTGHGELDAENDKLENGISYLRTALIKNSFKAEVLNIYTSGEIPKDTDLIVIAGGSKDFLKNELDLLNKYIQSGKPVLLFLQQDLSSTLLNLVSQTGWVFENEKVFNLLNSNQGPVIATDQATVANQFSVDNEITKFFSNQQSVLMFKPRFLTKSDAQLQEIILKTSDQAVSLPDQEIKKYKGIPASHTMGILVGKLAIYSDVSLSWNQFFYQASNKDLLMNTISFLANEKDLLSLAIKEPHKTPLKILGPDFNTYFRFIILGLFLPLPLVFLILMIFVWYKQRHA